MKEKRKLGTFVTILALASSLVVPKIIQNNNDDIVKEEIDYEMGIEEILDNMDISIETRGEIEKELVQTYYNISQESLRRAQINPDCVESFEEFEKCVNIVPKGVIEELESVGAGCDGDIKKLKEELAEIEESYIEELQ